MDTTDTRGVETRLQRLEYELERLKWELRRTSAEGKKHAYDIGRVWDRLESLVYSMGVQGREILAEVGKVRRQMEWKINHLEGVLLQESGNGRTIEAQRFIVRDQEGKLRAVLENRQAEGGTESETVLGLYDAAGKYRASLIVRDDGNPRLYMSDANGRGRTYLGVDDDGSPKLHMFDGNGRAGASLGVDDAGNPKLHMFDGNAAGRASLSMNRSGDPGLGMFDVYGKLRAWLGVPGTGHAFLEFFDADGKRLLTLPK